MTQDENNNSQEKKDAVVLTRSDKALIAIALIAIIVVFGLYLWYYPNGISTDHGSWGQFGDYFGGVLNPILGFFTVLLLIITLRISYQTLKVSKYELEKATDMLGLAKDEIKLTQKALDQSKEEVKLAKEATEKQVEHLEREAKKNELSKIIKEVDSDIQGIFNIQTYVSPNLRYGHYFSSNANNDMSAIGQFEFLNEQDQFHLDRLFSLLVSLDFILHIYELSFGRTVFTKHYKSKYYKTASDLSSYMSTALSHKQFKLLGNENKL